MAQVPCTNKGPHCPRPSSPDEPNRTAEASGELSQGAGGPCSRVSWCRKVLAPFHPRGSRRRRGPAFPRAPPCQEPLPPRLGWTQGSPCLQVPAERGAVSQAPGARGPHECVPAGALHPTWSPPGWGGGGDGKDSGAWRAELPRVAHAHTTTASSHCSHPQGTETGFLENPTLSDRMCFKSLTSSPKPFSPVLDRQEHYRTPRPWERHPVLRQLEKSTTNWRLNTTEKYGRSLGSGGASPRRGCPSKTLGVLPAFSSSGGLGAPWCPCLTDASPALCLIISGIFPCDSVPMRRSVCTVCVYLRLLLEGHGSYWNKALCQRALVLTNHIRKDSVSK